VLYRRTSTIILLFSLHFSGFAKTLNIGSIHRIKTIKDAIKLAYPGDTLLVEPGLYYEKNLIINKRLTLIGKKFPVITGEKRYEVVSIKANFVSFSVFAVKL